MSKNNNSTLTLAACCSAHAIQDGLGAALFVLMPVIAQTFGLNFTEVGMVRAVKSGAMTAFEMPSGLLSEKFGEQKLLIFGLLMAGTGCAYLASATTLTIILIAVLILGTGSGFQHALSSSIISATFSDKNRRSALGLYNSSGDAGKLAFTGFFAVATGMGMAWQGIMVFFAAITLIFALILILTFRRLAKTAAHSSGNQYSATRGWGIKNRKTFASLCLTVFLDTAVQSGFMVFIIFLIAEKGVSAHLAAFAMVLTLAGGMFGKAGCGFLAQRIGARKSFFLIQTATAIIIAGVLISPPLTALFLLPVLGMFLQGSTSITYSSIADLVATNRQSRGFAIIYSTSSLAAIIGPLAFGLISDHFSLTTAMYAMAIVSILAIVPGFSLKAAV